MAVLYPRLIFVFAAATIGACGIIDNGPGEIESSRPSPGTVMETGDWTCTADDLGAWDCNERDPDPPYVPTLPEVPKYQSEAQSEPSAEILLAAPAQSAPEPTPEPESAPVLNSETESLTEPIPEPDSQSESVEQQPAEPMSASGWAQISPEGYVLQLAAHRSRSNAESALSKMDAPEAEIVRTNAGGADLFVILLGEYANLTSAKTAASDFQERNEGADYWIRSATDLLGSL